MISPFAQLMRFRELAPLLSLALALVLPRIFSHDLVNAELVGPDPQTVVAAVDTLPYRIGEWTGLDTPMPEAAVRLLRPNAMVSRRYRNLDTGQTIEFVIVHCGDSRDMLGHYPPVCYPNAGWVYTDRVDDRRNTNRETLVELMLADRPFTASMYEFSRIAEWGMESSIRIFNFFILADGGLSYNIADVHRRGNWMKATANSVGQVQLLTEGDVSIEDAVSMANSILRGTAPMFEALGVRTNE